MLSVLGQPYSMYAAKAKRAIIIVSFEPINTFFYGPKRARQGLCACLVIKRGSSLSFRTVRQSGHSFLRGRLLQHVCQSQKVNCVVEEVRSVFALPRLDLRRIIVLFPSPRQRVSLVYKAKNQNSPFRGNAWRSAGRAGIRLFPIGHLLVLALLYWRHFQRC